MEKRKPTLDWQILEDRAPWPPSIDASGVSPGTRRIRRRWWWVVGILAAVLLPALVEGYREVRQADAVMDRIEREVAVVVEGQMDAETELQTGPRTTGAISTTSGAAVGSGQESVHGSGVEARHIEVRGDYAMVEVWVYQTDLLRRSVPYRQTRFFRQSAEGWRLTQPPDLFWQPQDTLQAGRFTFVYGARDRKAVLEAALQVELLDTELRAELGLPATEEAVTIQTETTLFLTLEPVDLSHASTDTVLHAPSPALLALPGEITEGEALLQLVAGLLIDIDLERALGHSEQACAWQKVTDGLRLWLLDEHSELPSPSLDNARAFLHRGQARTILPRLAWLGPTRGACSFEYAEHMTTSGAIHDGMAAAFVEYAVATYGRERLPALIAGMRRYGSWEELIPAVYGVSAAEFEAEWQGWLTRHD